MTNEITVGNWAQITMKSDYPQGHIFYTVDGSAPFPSSTPYNNSTLQFLTNVTIRAVAYNSTLSENTHAQLIINIVPTYKLRVTSVPADLVIVDPNHRIPENPPDDHGFYLSNSVVTVAAPDRPDLSFHAGKAMPPDPTERSRW